MIPKPYATWIEEGRLAARNGARRSPYRPGSLADTYWREGYQEVMREHEAPHRFNPPRREGVRYA